MPATLCRLQAWLNKPDLHCRDKLEELKLLHKMRKKTGGTNAHLLAAGAKDEFELPSDEPEAPHGMQLMGTFSKATAVVTTDEDPHMWVLGFRGGPKAVAGRHAAGLLNMRRAHPSAC